MNLNNDKNCWSTMNSKNIIIKLLFTTEVHHTRPCGSRVWVCGRACSSTHWALQPQERVVVVGFVNLKHLSIQSPVFLNDRGIVRPTDRSRAVSKNSFFILFFCLFPRPEYFRRRGQWTSVTERKNRLSFHGKKKMFLNYLCSKRLKKNNFCK